MPSSTSTPPVIEVFEAIPGDPVRDLAFEEELLRRASDGTCGLFLYSWPHPALVLGRGQPAGEVDLAFCEQAGIPVVRRLTGGTGVFHHGDLAVSLALPSSHPWSRGIGDLYDRFLDVVGSALRDVGVTTERGRLPFPSRPTRMVGASHAPLPGTPDESSGLCIPHAGATGARSQPCFQHRRSPICFENAGRETLLVSGRKAVGCAQARRRRAVLVHASMLLRLDPARYGAVFGVPAERISASIASLPPLDLAALREAIVAGFASTLDLTVRRKPIPAKTGGF